MGFWDTVKILFKAAIGSIVIGVIFTPIAVVLVYWVVVIMDKLINALGG